MTKGSDTDAGYNAIHGSGPNDGEAANGFTGALLSIPDVGEDSDFVRHDDAPRQIDLSPGE